MRGSYALDGGVLIALALNDPSARDLQASLGKGEASGYVSEPGLTELLYVLCRKAGWAQASSSVEFLLDSGVVQPVETRRLWKDAARYKCERSIALGDCFTLALARVTGSRALFARREREMEVEARRRAWDVEIAYLGGAA